MSERELREWVRSLDSMPACHPVRDAILRLLNAGPGTKGDDAKLAEGVDAAIRLSRRVDRLKESDERLTAMIGELAAQRTALLDRVKRLEEREQDFANKLMRQTAELRNQMNAEKASADRIAALEKSLAEQRKSLLEYKRVSSDVLSGHKAALSDIIAIVTARTKKSPGKNPKPKPATRQKARTK